MKLKFLKVETVKTLTVALMESDLLEGSVESIEEDDELEVSCLLQNLTLKVHSFESSMKERIKEDTPEEVIEEELPLEEKTAPMMIMPPPAPSTTPWDPVADLDDLKLHIDSLLKNMRTAIKKVQS